MAKWTSSVPAQAKFFTRLIPKLPHYASRRFPAFLKTPRNQSSHLRHWRRNGHLERTTGAIFTSAFGHHVLNIFGITAQPSTRLPHSQAIQFPLKYSKNIRVGADRLHHPP